MEQVVTQIEGSRLTFREKVAETNKANLGQEALWARGFRLWVSTDLAMDGPVWNDECHDAFACFNYMAPWVEKPLPFFPAPVFREPISTIHV